MNGRGSPKEKAMQRYLLIAALLLPLMIGGLAGCPGQPDEAADTSLRADAGAAPAAGDRTTRDGGSTARGTARGELETGQVVRNLFEQRSQIEEELAALTATPLAPQEEISNLKQQMSAIDQQVADLAQTDYAGVEAELKKLAEDDAKTAAEWQRMIADPTSAPSIPEGIDDLPLSQQAGDEIGLLGQPYTGAMRPIEELRGQLTEIWQVRFTTTFGDFTIEVYPELAPIHAVRFLELVEAAYYDKMHIQRIDPGWVVQWGDLADLSQQDELRPGQDAPIYPQYRERAKLIKSLKDEPARFYTSAWTVCFAKDEDRPNSATTQPFINLADNDGLASKGFTPFGYVTEGRDSIQRLVTRFEPVMASAREQLREEMRAAGKSPPEIEMKLQDEAAWAPYVTGWDPFRDALIRKAEIVARP